MSRSIHATRADFRRAEWFDFADADQRQEHLRILALGIRKKRRIKQLIRTARKTPERVDLAPVPPDAIPIEIVDSGPGILYAASQADFVGVLNRLPAGVLTGLASIRLCLGKEYQDESLPADERADASRDPWVGRAGSEVLPGVFGGRCLGTYWGHPTRIDLYAFVHDPATPPPATWEIFLRLHLLTTFVHEVAHHQDQMHRLEGRRWRGESVARDEAYAETAESLWVQQCVVPYLEAAYPDAVGELRAWIRDHGGVTLPLAAIAGEYQLEAVGKAAPVSFGSAQDAFTALVRHTVHGDDPKLVRLLFALQLSSKGYHDEALTVVRELVAGQPTGVTVLTIAGDIHARAGHHREAESLCLRAVQHDATRLDAWQNLADVYEAVGNWAALREAADKALALVDDAGDRAREVLLYQRARANLELGFFEDVAVDLDRLAALSATGLRRTWAVRGLLLLQTGRYEEAIAHTETCTPNAGSLTRAVFRCIRFLAARKLGLPDAGTPPSAATLDDLRRYSYGTWADRVAAEMAP